MKFTKIVSELLRYSKINKSAFWKNSVQRMSTHTSFLAVSKINVTSPFRMFANIKRIDLPLNLPIHDSHKKIKQALMDSKKEIPQEMFENINNCLKEIQSVKWQKYNSKNLELHEVEKVQNLLRDLLKYEESLTPLLTNELAKSNPFQGLRDGIEALDERCGRKELEKFLERALPSSKN